MTDKIAAAQTHIFNENSWEPVVEFGEGHFIYVMPVSCGYFDKSFRFAISKTQFEILKADVERRYFLYAVLHYLYQPKAMRNGHQQDPHFALILSGSQPDVEALLTRHDAGSKGAVSNLAASLLTRDQAEIREGRWFLNPSDPV